MKLRELLDKIETYKLSNLLDDEDEVRIDGFDVNHVKCLVWGTRRVVNLLH